MFKNKYISVINTKCKARIIFLCLILCIIYVLIISCY
jgi:hypothetical protein